MAIDRTQRLLRFVTHWASDPKRRIAVRDANLSRLEQALAARELAVIHGRAVGYATWLCAEGQARVLGGDTQGWQSVRLGSSFLHQAWRVAFRAWSSTQGTVRLPNQPISLANTVALALTLEAPDTQELYRWLQAGWPRSTPLPAYAIYVQELLALRAGQRAERAEEAGVHGAILKAWNEDGLGAALDAALEWHTQAGTDGSDDAIGEFVSLEAHAMPVEVLAVMSVRRQLGLSVPTLSHRLGRTPLCAVPQGVPWPTDPLLERLQEVASSL